MLHVLHIKLGLTATFWIAGAAGAQSVAAPRERAGPAAAALEVQPAAVSAADRSVDDSDKRDNGGLELRASAVGGVFEGPIFGLEASAALFTAPRDDEPVQFGLEAQLRHVLDTEPEGTVEDAALTSLTANLILRAAHGQLRPYAGVGVGGEIYHYDSSFSDTSDSIGGFVYQGFLGTTIDLDEDVFLDLRLTVADRDYEETVDGRETIYARDVSVMGAIGIGFRL